MYRDEPLDDEAELRFVVGDDEVDLLRDAGSGEATDAALDALRVLQGWVSDEVAGRWFRQEQRRLGGRTPIRALVEGDLDAVLDAARAYAAAHG
ncbi:MAG: antitoxin Xre/MbcA/ParS toxin-binding domain-containing protein [Nitriliruptorales bacterium]|nr:antitoxin Xre/MbcA/ParS toxin-binding domain-containing protein [Nitriliruptorales bacterium]